MKNLFFFSFFLLLSCSQGGDNDPEPKSVAVFDPAYRGIRGAFPPSGTPLPIQELTIEPQAGALKVSWKTPVYYMSEKLKIGYRIYRKSVIVRASDSPPITWSFVPYSEDWQNERGRVKAASCDKASERCSFTDDVGPSVTMEYAVLSYWDVEKDPSFDEPGSTTLPEGINGPGIIRGTSLARDGANSFNLEILKEAPGLFLGLNDTPYANDSLREPSGQNFSFASLRTPAFFLERLKEITSFSSDTSIKWSVSNYASSVRLRDPVEMSSTRTLGGLHATVIPDENFERAHLSGSLIASECDAITDVAKRVKCITESASGNFGSMIGQKIEDASFLRSTQSSLPSGSQAEKLANSRVFKSRSVSRGTSSTGATYLFVADEARILVRKGGMEACERDQGELPESQEHLCGFQWSLGTKSPRKIFPDQPSNYSNSERLTYADEIRGRPGRSSSVICNNWNLECYLRDRTPPTASSLRYPRAPKIIGSDLVIPDTGNARVVVIKNFEEKLKTCGRLKPSSDPEDEACAFDFVIGQTALTETDGKRFQSRECLRGGERYFESSPKAYPPFFPGNPSAGVACSYDLMPGSTLADGLVENKRELDTHDFLNIPSSDIQTTGVLSERSQRLFRAPTQIETDGLGNLYVLDSGYTIVSGTGTTKAVLDSRVMMWPIANVLNKQCLGTLCNATAIFGQPNLRSGWVVKSSEVLGISSFPQGYHAISGFQVNVSDAIPGLLTVSGEDNLVHYYRNRLPSLNPEVLNSKPANRDTAQQYQLGAYGGIYYDSVTRILYLLDPKYHSIYGYVGSYRSLQPFFGK